MESERDEDYPIGVLIEELRGEDLHVRLHSIRKISTIALALGPEKTRSQLIPFLTETIYDEDEVLLTLAEQIGTLVPYVGGPEYAHSLLPPLESLAAVEETVVRDRAVEALRKLAPDHTTEAMEKYFNPLLHRLATGDWFTSRTSACALFSVVYPRVRSSKRWELLDFLRRLAKDETPMVRRAVAARLGELALAMSVGQSSEKPSADGETSSQISEHNSSSMTNSITESKMLTNEVVSLNGGQVSYGVTADERLTNDSIAEKPSTHANPPQSDDFTLDPEKERSYIITILVPLFVRLVDDEQESVRLMAVESIVQLAQALGPEESEGYLIDLIQQATTDRSWRVRCVVADKFTEIQTAMGLRVSRERLVPFFMKLLHDEEAEVRAFAAGKVKAFAKCLLGLPVDADINTTDKTINSDTKDCKNSSTTITSDNKIMEIDEKFESVNDLNDNNSLGSKDDIIMLQLLPAIKSLTNESNTHVKSSLASAILGLAPLIGKNLTIEHLLPIFLTQLNDDNPEVRLNVISNLEQVNSIIGIDHLTINLLPAIIQLAEDPKWRVRLAIIEYMPLLAEQLGLEFFNNQLVDLCLSWLIDQVYAIREAAVDNLVNLCKKFGSEWASQYFIPKIIHLSRGENYLHRMICLQSIISLCKVVSPTICCQYLLPTVLSMHTDNVPNIRFKVAQALSNLGSQLEEKNIENEVKSCLTRLVEDSDTDVKFYAYEAMDTLKITTSSKPFQCYYIKVKQNNSSNDNPIQNELLPSSTTTVTAAGFDEVETSLSSLSIVNDLTTTPIVEDNNDNNSLLKSQSPTLVNNTNSVDGNVNCEN
ncbi:putative serine/threonine protein phosphatase 2a regulatory subunit A [Schistosoma mansoni]|uniref:putative serine/threonine protein phosphatase 2a regulatory subunit A n=1 Tax=Schistosoma mansoni TaxID=6183 RepID=UPI0001A63AED|nr:putative serine/threonine protein phosphatase 2a regulatory subunit A [Schistosoma mansoni]|eukprot:XP_018652645.1 putative serine/threonine protein phosphatase 2a regulatory subunit A [Schistosoma mansoni]